MAYKFLLSVVLVFSVYAETRYVVIGSGKLNVREKPVDGKVIFQLNKGDKVQTKSDETESDWVGVTLQNGKKGFVSSEFLSRHTFEEIEKAEMIGILQNADRKDTAVLRVLGLKLGKWKGSSDVLPEYSYLGKKIIQDKEKISLYSDSGSGVMLLKEPVKWGCQNINGFKGTVNPQMYSVISSEKGSVLAYYGNGKLSSSVLKEIKDKKRLKKLQATAVKILLSKKISADKIKNLASSAVHEFEHPVIGKNFISARFSVQKDFMKDKIYTYYIVSSENPEKILFEHTVEQTDEMAAYGGQYYPVSAYFLDGVFHLVFSNSGFDSHIFSIHSFDGKTLKEMIVGAGDAC